MIKINLLPDEFRIVKKSSDHGKYFFYGTLAGVIFMLVTLGFYMDYLVVLSQFKKVETDWRHLEPESKELNTLRSQVEGELKREKAFMEQFVTTQRPLTHRIQWCSELLPETSWLTEIELKLNKEAGSFLVKGLALPSKEASSIGQIETFLQSLKAKMPEAKLSLMTTRQRMEGFDLTQFTANFIWGGETSAGKSKTTVKKSKAEKPQPKAKK